MLVWKPPLTPAKNQTQQMTNSNEEDKQFFFFLFGQLRLH